MITTPAGVYHKFDPMAYPPSKQLRDYMYIGANKEFSVPTPGIMRKDSLNYYLTSYQKLLIEGNFQADFDISQIFHGIQHIYNQMKVQVTVFRKSAFSEEVETLKEVSY